MNYDVLLWECDIAWMVSGSTDYLHADKSILSHAFVRRMMTAAPASTHSKPCKTTTTASRLHKYVAARDNGERSEERHCEGCVLPKVLVQKTIPQFASMDRMAR